MNGGYAVMTYAPGSTIDWIRYSSAESPSTRVLAVSYTPRCPGPTILSSAVEWQRAQLVA